jgi:acetyl esterase/lipase
VIAVHGGAWSAGDKADCAEIGNFLAGQGYVTFSISYRLVTDTGNRWPAQLEDAQRAVRWVRSNAGRFAVDPGRIAAIGGSAGGHIVACLGTLPPSTDEAGVSSRVTCIVSLAGPTDLSDDFAGQVAQGAWTAEQVRRLFAADPRTTPAARAASPLFQVCATSVPALVIQGRQDDVVPWRQAERYVQALHGQQVEAELVLLEKAGHGIEDPLELVRCMGAIGGFLARHLHP